MFRTPIILVAVAAFAGVGCGSNERNGMMTGGMMTGPSAAPSPGAFVSVSPAGGAAGVPVSGSIAVRFTRPMAAGMEQYIDLHEGDTSGPVVLMTCTWSGDRTTATCQPAQPLKHHTQYAIHVGAGMMDADDLPVNMTAGLQDGGQWLMPTMMNGRHAGSPMGMMGPGWRGSNGSYGMVFPFTTA